MVICVVVLVFLGISWGSVGIVGLVLMGIGEGFDIFMYWMVGVVVLGVFFGDKVLLLLDIINFVLVVIGIDVFLYIKNMMVMIIFVMVFVFLIYFGVGFFVIDVQSVLFVKIVGIISVLEDNFIVMGWVLLLVFVVMGLVLKKIFFFFVLFVGVVVGGVFVMFM